MMSQKRSLSGAEALFGAAFFYALTGIFIREVAPMWGDNAQVAVRYSLVLFFLLGYALIKKNTLRVPKSHISMVIALSILFALVVLFFTAAIGKTTVANSLFTFYAANMVTSFLLGSLILREKISVSRIIAIVLALAGLSVYTHALLAGSLGLVYGITAGLCDGISNVLRKKLSSINRNTVIFFQFLIGAIFTILVTIFSRQEIIRQVSLRGSILTLIFAFILIAAANLILYGYKNFDVNMGAVIMSTELIFAAVMAYVLFHESLATHELIGGCLIFVGSIVGSGALGKVAHKQVKTSKAK